MKDSITDSAMEFKTINPATEDVISQYQIMTKDQINDKVKKSKIAYRVEKRCKQKNRFSLISSYV